jgi:bifunctional UDP-N-acetylglucosamine pyrophosphorylase/glucosamine-1-phosphate N-acetyltransferase
MVLLVAETEATSLKANPNTSAAGTVIESNVDKAAGPLATILVQNGTLRVGDQLCFNEVIYGKVKSLKNYKVQYAIQSEQLGSGHAVACAKNLIKPETENIIVLYCDHPFLSAESLKKCAAAKIETVMVMTTKLADFEDWRRNFYHWGRFVRNAENEIERIVEFKDATPEEQAIAEVNPGFMAFNNSWLWPNIKLLSNNNSQHEYYLTSLPGMAFAEGYKIPSISIEAQEAMGINSPEELAIAEELI